MNIYTKICHLGFCAFLGATICMVPESVSAEESTSFRLYHEAPNYAERGPAASSNFQMNEDGITWVAYPLTSTSFQIVTAPPAVAEEPPPAGEEEEEEEQPGGGRRGAEDRYKEYPERKPFKPAAPEEEQKPALEPAKLFEDVKFRPEEMLEPPSVGVRYPRFEKRLPEPLHYFRVVDGPKQRCRDIRCPDCSKHLLLLVWLLIFLVTVDISVRVRKRDNAQRKKKKK